MDLTRQFDEFASRLSEWMVVHGQTGEAEDAREHTFSRLAQELFSLQYAANEPYRCFCNRRGATPARVSQWSEIPAVPTAAFKELELSCLSPERRTHVFFSSGTSEHRPSRHFHNATSLRLYEASVLAWFCPHLLLGQGVSPGHVADGHAGTWEPLPPCEWELLFLSPPPSEALCSSLVYMFETIRRAFGSSGSRYLGKAEKGNGWILDAAAAVARLQMVARTRTPVVLLGTAFSFVHLLDFLMEHALALRLPPGSRVMETGGYKGRSRALPKAELHSLIQARLDVPATHLVSEYGMSELSSQAYDRAVPPSCVGEPEGRAAAALGSPTAPVFRFPAWARAQVVSAETGREVQVGETGLLRIFDLANVYSIVSLQTEDLAVRRGTGFELLGRAPQAEPRGCSLMINCTP